MGLLPERIIIGPFILRADKPRWYLREFPNTPLISVQDKLSIESRETEKYEESVKRFQSSEIVLRQSEVQPLLPYPEGTMFDVKQGEPLAPKDWIQDNTLPAGTAAWGDAAEIHQMMREGTKPKDIIVLRSGR